MKTSAASLLLATALVVCSLAGCSTFRSRAEEKADVYNSLSPQTQQRLQRGTINVNDTQDMVYIALGDPDEKRQVTTADGTREIWIYRSYWEQYEGTAWVGYHRVIVPTSRGHYAIFHEPITADVYRRHADEVIRVTFSNERVVSVEENKR